LVLRFGGCFMRMVLVPPYKTGAVTPRGTP
jgi:hypothetical protein